jgi:hypothetical protein
MLLYQVDILDRMAYHSQVPDACAVFTDVLGFGSLSENPGASGAVDALSALANLLSRSDILGAILNWSGWEGKYALSDSIFLVSPDTIGAITAAAELFFSLAYISHSGESPVLMRGGASKGEVLEVAPIFPQSATANLVGPAVVRAVRLEGSPPKGPRLFVDDAIAATLEESTAPVKWLLDAQDGSKEVLWLLPPDPAMASGRLIGELSGKILLLVQLYAKQPEIGQHYIGYLTLLIRSLSRLLAVRPDQAKIALDNNNLRARLQEAEEVLVSPHQEILSQEIRRITR